MRKLHLDNFGFMHLIFDLVTSILTNLLCNNRQSDGLSRYAASQLIRDCKFELWETNLGYLSEIGLGPFTHID